ncbi:histidinol-phosphate transaminase [bacterium]|nr:histidinol-phosphate transaminase [bacterium]
MSPKSVSVAPPALNPHLMKLQPYPPGKPIEEVKREFGLDEVIKLASNENPLGPSPRAMKAMAAVAAEMHLYPDGAAFYLRDALAKKLSVSPNELILGNGSDEIALLLMLAYAGPTREVITSQYSFIRYLMEAELAGAPVTLVPMRDMRHDLKAIAAAVNKRTAMICLDVPCNPTGSTLTKRELTRFLDAVPQDVIILLDQAYFEYAAALDPDFPDGTTLRARRPNLVVTRTFSKAYGLAGLRLGYAIARPEIVTDVNRIRPPFNANRMVQAAGIAALGDAAFLRRATESNRRGMAQMVKGLDKLGIRHWPSVANFILTDVGRDCREVFTELLKLGVVTRPMAGYGLATHLRISIGTRAENAKCLAAMKTVLQ